MNTHIVGVIIAIFLSLAYILGLLININTSDL